MKLSEVNAGNSIPKNYKPKQIAGAFDEKYISEIYIEYKRKSDEKQSIEQYLEKVRPYLSNNNLRTSGEWIIHLTTKINFVSSKNSHEKSLKQYLLKAISQKL